MVTGRYGPHLDPDQLYIAEIQWLTKLNAPGISDPRGVQSVALLDSNGPYATDA